MRKGIVIVLLLSVALHGWAQDSLLTLEQAISTALEQNYGIRLARIDQQITENNVSIGNAGMLPNVDLSGSQSTSITNTEQEFINGDQVVRSGAKSSSLTGGSYLNWTIFDGLGMFATYDKLKALNQLSQAQLEVLISNTVAAVQETYYELVQQKGAVAVAEQSLALTQERMQLAQDRYEIGSGSKLEYLNAQVDYNADRNQLMQQKEAMESARIQLNTLLGRKPDVPISPADSIGTDKSLDYGALYGKMNEQNPELLAAHISERVAGHEVREAKARRYPEIGVQGNYAYTRSQSEAGFLVSNKNNGLSFGLTASLPVFHGFNINRAIENARMMAERQALQSESLGHELEGELATIYVSYLNNLDLIKLESENLDVAKENLDISKESYEVGGISALELRETQQSYVDAQYRLLLAQYRAKVAEIELRLLAGELVMK